MASIQLRVFSTAILISLIGVACGSSDDEAAPVTTTVAAEVLGDVETDDPSTTVPATTTVPPTSAPTTAPTTTAAPERDFSAIDPIVSTFVDERGLNGAGLVIVDREDGIVHEDYWGEFDENRISYIASSSKMIAAGVLLRLQDDGLLDMDEPIADYVDWGAANPDITTAQLVSNSSGLIGLLQDFTYEPYLCQWNPVGSLQECAETIFTTPDDDAAPNRQLWGKEHS